MKKVLKPYFTAANKKTKGKPEMLGLPSEDYIKNSRYAQIAKKK